MFNFGCVGCKSEKKCSQSKMQSKAFMLANIIITVHYASLLLIIRIWYHITTDRKTSCFVRRIWRTDSHLSIRIFRTTHVNSCSTSCFHTKLVTPTMHWDKEPNHLESVITPSRGCPSALVDMLHSGSVDINRTAVCCAICHIDIKTSTSWCKGEKRC